MKFPIEAIDLDVSIQCRAAIDTAVVNDYAERMDAGDDFPPVVLFGTRASAWIGDGWHRILGAKQLGRETIAADLRPGGRADALKHALSANAVHGHRRTNADKRRAVEIALREFPRLSSRGIAKLCGVSHVFVESLRPRQVETVTTSPERLGADGKTYPAQREPRESRTADYSGPFAPTPGAPVWSDDGGLISGQVRAGDASDDDPAAARPLPRSEWRPRSGMQFARLAIRQLEQIAKNDEERADALRTVKEWIDGQA